MNERIDEEIGALLDGRVPEPRRSELLTLLAADDDDYEVFADTAAVLREAEEGESAGNESIARREPVRETGVPREAAEGEPAAEEPVDRLEAVRETPVVGETPVVRETPVIPLRPRRGTGWRSPAVRALAAAAVLAAVVAVPVLRSGLNADGWRKPERLVALATNPGEPLAPGWIDRPPWRVTRGGFSGRETGLAARVGARSTDLMVAAYARDRVATPRLATEIATALNTVSGSSFVAAEYRRIADSTAWSRPKVLKRVADAYENLATVVDRDYLAVGAWAEAARLAARQENATFFATRESREALEQAATLEGLSGEGKQRVSDLQTLQGQGEIYDWRALQDNLDILLQELAR